MNDLVHERLLQERLKKINLSAASSLEDFSLHNLDLRSCVYSSVEFFPKSDDFFHKFFYYVADPKIFSAISILTTSEHFKKKHSYRSRIMIALTANPPEPERTTLTRAIVL